MIPLHFGYAYWDPAAAAEADTKPAVIVPVHAHCWMDPSHVIVLQVTKKTKDDEMLFSCSQCDVREKTVRCRKRKCMEPVPA